MEGYAASAEYVGAGAQLCQHHCPVSHVAEEFPQLCEAETAAFADLLGVHVQRLATIARGDAVCTTHVPEARVPHSARTTVSTTPTTQRMEASRHDDCS
jgi:predicted ArsR family transcriptional regulator